MVQARSPALVAWEGDPARLTSVHDLVLLPEICQAPENLQAAMGRGGVNRAAPCGDSPLDRSSGQNGVARV